MIDSEIETGGGRVKEWESCEGPALACDSLAKAIIFCGNCFYAQFQRPPRDALACDSMS